MDCNLLGAWWFEYIAVFQGMKLLQGSWDQLQTFLMPPLTCTLTIHGFKIHVYTRWTRIFLMYFKAKKTKTRSTGQWWYWHPHRGPHCKAQLLYPPLIHKNPESTTTSNLTTFLLTALVRASCCVSSGHRKQHLQEEEQNHSSEVFDTPMRHTDPCESIRDSNICQEAHWTEFFWILNWWVKIQQVTL